LEKICKKNPRIQIIGEMNRCDIQIEVGIQLIGESMQGDSQNTQLIGEMHRCDIQIEVRIDSLLEKVCKETPRIQLIGEMNRCDIQIEQMCYPNRGKDT
jgi:hypothetical protein